MSNFETTEKPVSWYSYFTLVLVILFFSGFFSGSTNWWGFMDFTTLNGMYGTISEKINFLGKGGFGAMYGFLFAFSLIPGIMLALGIVEVAEKLDALRAAQKLLTPVMRPLLGLPGSAGLALITCLQSSDAGAAMTKDLYDKKLITDKERLIFSAFQFSSGSSITVYLSMGVTLFPFLSVSHLIPLGVILFYKVVGTNLMRLYLHCIRYEKPNTD